MPFLAVACPSRKALGHLRKINVLGSLFVSIIDLG
jgi:hypothetical protein